MRVACLFSGGKDSAFAAFCCMFQAWDTTLLTMRSGSDSFMFHHPNTKWCGAQARAMGLPIRFVETKNERELGDLKAALARMKKQGKIDAVVSGALASEYQKQRIDQIANELEIRSLSPLWHVRGQLMREVLENFETYVVAVAAEGLDESYLGARFDKKMAEKISRLKIPVHPMFEGGEAETFVADAPFFSTKLRVARWKKEWKGTSGLAEIVELKEEKKK